MVDLDGLIAEARRHVPYAGSLDDNWCIHCADEWPCVTRSLADALEAATRVPVQGEPSDVRVALAELIDAAFWCAPKQGSSLADAYEIDSMITEKFSQNLGERLLAAGFSRATVPDAVTEELETLRDIAETHAFCADRLSIETERADRVAREVCDRGCSYTGGPDEECSAHGRTPRELWEFIAQDIAGRDAATARAEKAEAERDAATAAIAAVRAIHASGSIIDVWGKSRSQPDDFLVCVECTDPDNNWCAYPCATVAALDGAPEPEAVEWEYAVGGMNPGSTEAWAHDEDDISSNFDTARAWTDEAIASGSFSNAIVVKRRVNPWLPVEGETP